MKAVGYMKPGDAGVFQWLDLPEPAVQARDILVRVEAVSVNPADFKVRTTQGSNGLFADPRLIWVDAMWIDDRGDLLLPASQLNRTAGLNGGNDTVEQPITLYRYHIGHKGTRT